MSKLLDTVMGKTQTFTVQRSPTVGLGIVMKEALMEVPESEEKIPVIIITELKPEGPALEAGVHVGDIVVSVGEPQVNVSTFDQFGACVQGQSTVILTILRGDANPSRDGKDGSAQTAADPEASTGSETAKADEAPAGSREDAEGAAKVGTPASTVTLSDHETPKGEIGETGDQDVPSKQDNTTSTQEPEDESSSVRNNNGDDDYVEGSYSFDDEEDDEEEEDDDDEDEEEEDGDGVVTGDDDDEAEEDDEEDEDEDEDEEAESDAAYDSHTQVTTSPAPPLPHSQVNTASTNGHVVPSPARPPQRTRSGIDLKGDEPLEILWRGTKEIAAGQEFTVPINVSFPFGRLKWSFELSGADVDFSIIPQNSGTTPVAASLPLKRLTNAGLAADGTKNTLSGELKFTEPVMLVVTWSNAYSWMKSKKVTYTLRVDDHFLREKKKALASAVETQFRASVDDNTDAGPDVQQKHFTDAVETLPTDLNTFQKLPQLKVHAMHRVRFGLEEKLAVLAKQARALRQVTANTKLSYEQDIARIRALVDAGSDSSQTSPTNANSSAARGQNGNAATEGDEETVANLANQIELEVFLDAYKHAFAHLTKRERALRAENVVVTQELHVINGAIDALATDEVQ